MGSDACHRPHWLQSFCAGSWRCLDRQSPFGHSPGALRGERGHSVRPTADDRDDRPYGAGGGPGVAQGSLNLKLPRPWVPAGNQETTQIFQACPLAPCCPSLLAPLGAHSPAVTLACVPVPGSCCPYPPLGRAQVLPHGALEFPGLSECSYTDSGRAGHSGGSRDQNWEPKATQLSLGPERLARPGRWSPPGGRGVAPRIQPLPSPSTPPATLPSSSERPLLADRRGMSSGGSRHVTRRRSNSSPSRGSNFQPQPWEQRRAPLAPPGRVRRRRWPAALTRRPGVWVSL